MRINKNIASATYSPSLGAVQSSLAAKHITHRLLSGTSNEELYILPIQKKKPIKFAIHTQKKKSPNFHRYENEKHKFNWSTICVKNCTNKLRAEKCCAEEKSTKKYAECVRTCE